METIMLVILKNVNVKTKKKSNFKVTVQPYAPKMHLKRAVIVTE